MNKPLVTIITPVYNCNPFIDETISSVINQKGGNPEYIIIDDASTDGFNLQSDELITVIRHTINQGEQRTVNEGLKRVETKYFMIVNADDPLLPYAVGHLVEYMEDNPDVVCAYPDYNIIGEDSKIRYRTISRDYEFKWMVRHHTWLPSVGSIFRSSLLETIGYRDTSFTWLGDADFWLRVGLAGRMAHVTETLATWRKHEGQATNIKSRARAREHIRVMEKFYSTPDLPRYLLDVKNEAICWSLLVASVVTDSNWDTVKYGCRAVWSYPGLITDLEFWDTMIKKLWYLLRR